jgi:hypothetical protein
VSTRESEEEPAPAASERTDTATSADAPSQYAPTAPRYRKPWLDALLLLIALIELLTLFPHNLRGDGGPRFAALSQLLEGHGIPAIKYSLIGPLFSAPLWLLGKATSTPQTLVEVYNWVVFAVGLLALYLLLRNVMDRRVLRTFLLLLVAASMFPAHTLSFYAETFTAVAVAIGSVLAVFGRRLAAFGGWALAVLGIANIPANILGFASLTALYALRRRRLRYLAAVVAAIALILAEAWLRRGSPFANGYAGDSGFHTVMPYSGGPGFNYPIFFGVLAILLSFGKGLLFFTPGLFLPARRYLLAQAQGAENGAKLYTLYLLWLAFVGGMVIVYAHWWAWYGGWFWGPRFFLFASIPAALVLAVRLHARDAGLGANLLTLAALALSFWVGINGVVFEQQGLSACTAHNYAQEFLCQFTPEFSALWHPFVVFEPLSPGAILYTASSSAIFLYLALPLLIRTTRQIADRLRDTAAVYLRREVWRF